MGRAYSSAEPVAANPSALRRLLRWLLPPLVAVLAHSAPAAQVSPFIGLRDAYAAHDPAAAAAVYADNAVVRYAYTNSPIEVHRGRRAIEASFRQLFDQIDPEALIDLNFRITAQSGDAASGIYRLRVGRSASYGFFETVRGVDGRFLADASRSASADDFEHAAGPLLIANEDEVLDRRWYNRLVGRYRGVDGCVAVVTRSVKRLFVRDSCTGDWRALTRVSGHVWTAGDRTISGSVTAVYRFVAPPSGAPVSTLAIERGGQVINATRQVPYRTEDVTFLSRDGVRLAGTLYIPTGLAQARPASALVHGSGPQDRDGYASIIAVLADQLAANGRVVLAFDKRGSGDSGGNGARAGFDILAQDAIAAMTYLRGRPEVLTDSVGLAGSSQAGWVAARAVELGGRPADVLLLGAAGAGVTVAEQNLYNSETRMRCAGIAASDVALATDQQRAFYAYLADPQEAATLDALTLRAATRPRLRDWLMPASTATDRQAAAWYVVLDTRFDPLPVWRAYSGRTLFIFGDRDDSTPTGLVVDRLRTTAVRTRVLPGAQHLGLDTDDLCRGDLVDVARFSPTLMGLVAEFASPQS